MLKTIIASAKTNMEQCPHCQKDVTHTANSCPSCGHNLSDPINTEKDSVLETFVGKPLDFMLDKGIPGAFAFVWKVAAALLSGFIVFSLCLMIGTPVGLLIGGVLGVITALYMFFNFDKL